MQSPSFDLSDVKTVYDTFGNRKEVILSYKKFQQIENFLRRFRADIDQNEPESQYVPDPEQSAIDQEEIAYRKLHPSLVKEYLGQYVAIYGGELIDHDTDQVALYLRVNTRYPDEFVWISPVRPEPEELYINRSPRFNGAG